MSGQDTDISNMGQGGEGAGKLGSAAANVAQAAKSAWSSATGGNQDPRTSQATPPFAPQTQSVPGDQHKMSPEPDYGYKSYKGSGKLTDKVALITGGDSGIGRAIALAYAREGADVAVAYLNEHEDAEETKKVVEEAGRRCVLLPGDLATEAGCQAAVKGAVNALGRIDILVNNASVQGAAVDDLRDISRERLERTFNTNVIAMFNLVQLALSHMAEGSSIINCASIQGYSPTPRVLDYATTKAAIVGMTKGMSTMLAEKHGIRVNAVAPGPIWTPMPQSSFPASAMAEFGKQVPLKRPGQPKEVAAAFVFLASPEASYISGEVLAVTGGSPTA